MSRFRLNWLAVYAIVYLIFLYAPVALLPLFSFNDSSIVASAAGIHPQLVCGSLENRSPARRRPQQSDHCRHHRTPQHFARLCAARAASRYAFRMKRGTMG